jgi:Leucine-rich repeat (LRR) protein
MRFETPPRVIFSLAGLRSLTLGNSEYLSELPEELGELSQLRRLDIRYCPKLRRLPKSFARLSKLEELDVSGTRIDGLLDHLSALPALRNVDVGDSSLVPELYRKTRERFPQLQLSVTPGTW